MKVNGLINIKRNIILDLDGVVYHGSDPIPGAVEAIDEFRKAGKRLAFLTNNSASTPEAITEKLRKMGIKLLDGEVITSGLAALLLLQQSDLYKKVYVCGTTHLRSLFERSFDVVEDSTAADVIVVGMDPEFTYEKISRVLPGLLAHIPFIACNRDAFYPVGENKFKPGCGAMVGALEAASNRKADVEVGKPNTKMLELVCSRFGFLVEESLMVGDTFTSDIVMARSVGMDAVWIREEPTNKLESAGSVGSANSLRELCLGY